MQTTATPTADGNDYILNGDKRYITNGGIAGVLTVMARTPVPGTQRDARITAFLVTPDMPGFEVVEARMPKCGIRGTATARLAFHNMPRAGGEHPRPARQGPARRPDRARLRPHHLRRQLHRARPRPAWRPPCRHAKTRVQFEQPLAEFELVKKKIAFMAAHCLRDGGDDRPSAPRFIDRGPRGLHARDGHAQGLRPPRRCGRSSTTRCRSTAARRYFTDEPYERMMRDARINKIGEGANDVLRAFIALVGMRDPGLALKDVLDSVKSPMGGLGKLTDFARRHLPGQGAVHVPARHPEVAEPARLLEEVYASWGEPWKDS